MKPFLVIFTHIGPLKGVNMSSRRASWEMKMIKKSILGQNLKKFSFLAKNGQIFNICKAKASWEKSEKSDASLWKYEQKSLILGYFGPFLAKKGSILNFGPKSETVTFYSYRATASWEKIRKIWCADFSEMNNARTDVRTNGRESIGLQESRFLENKNVYYTIKNLET